MKRFVALSTLLMAAFVAESAAAQTGEHTWLSDRRYREGAGWRVGDFELHPGLGVDFGYDSNFLRRHSSEDPVQSLRLRVSPHFSVSTLGPQRRGDGPPPTVEFRFEIAATYNEFIPITGSEVDKEFLRDSRNVGGDTGIQVGFLPGREWSGTIEAGVGRTIRPTNNTAQSTTGFNRITPHGAAWLTWAPGSGLLDWSLGYGFDGTFFEDSEFSGLNNFRNDILTRGRWRFLPRTALMYDASFGFVTYPDPNASLARKTNSHPMRARIGVNGLVTPSFGVLALVGWGASFYDDPLDTGTVHDFDSVLAQAEVKWYLDPVPDSDPMKASASLSSLALGFVRDYEDSYIGSYVEKNFGYLRFNYLFGGQFLLVATAQGGALIYPEIPVYAGFESNKPDGWTDGKVDASLFGEWRIKDWLGINADLGYEGYFSGTSLEPEDTGGVPGVADRLGYNIFTAFLGLRAFL